MEKQVLPVKKILSPKLIFIPLVLIVLALGLEGYYYLKLKSEIGNGNNESQSEPTGLQSDESTRNFNYPEELEKLVEKKLEGKILKINQGERIYNLTIKYKEENGKEELLNATIKTIYWFPVNGEYDPNKSPSLEELVNFDELEMTFRENGVLQVIY